MIDHNISVNLTCDRCHDEYDGTYYENHINNAIDLTEQESGWSIDGENVLCDECQEKINRD